jgi:hypothetical protein
MKCEVDPVLEYIGDDYDHACIIFAAGGKNESADEIASRFGISRTTVYKRAQGFRKKYGFRNIDRRFCAFKEILCGLLNTDESFASGEGFFSP